MKQKIKIKENYKRIEFFSPSHLFWTLVYLCLALAFFKEKKINHIVNNEKDCPLSTWKINGHGSFLLNGEHLRRHSQLATVQSPNHFQP